MLFTKLHYKILLLRLHVVRSMNSDYGDALVPYRSTIKLLVNPERHMCTIMLSVDWHQYVFRYDEDLASASGNQDLRRSSVEAVDSGKSVPCVLRLLDISDSMLHSRKKSNRKLFQQLLIYMI